MTPSDEQTLLEQLKNYDNRSIGAMLLLAVLGNGACQPKTIKVLDKLLDGWQTSPAISSTTPSKVRNAQAQIACRFRRLKKQAALKTDIT